MQDISVDSIVNEDSYELRQADHGSVFLLGFEQLDLVPVKFVELGSEQHAEYAMVLFEQNFDALLVNFVLEIQIS